MPKATEIKRGDVVQLNDQLLRVRDVEVHSPSARGAATLYKMRFSNVRTGLKQEERYKGDDLLTTVALQKRPVSFSYSDGDEFVFMDVEDFTQFAFKRVDIEDELEFITESVDGISVMLVEDQLIGLELPQSVDLPIMDTAPAMKGASASARTKPATFSTGLVIQVPEYLEAGETVRIHTGERRFMGRAEQ